MGGVLPTIINGFPLKTAVLSPMLQALVSSATDTDHVLVIVQMNGGNDGVNTVLSLDQNYANLQAARSNILIPQAKVLKLNGTNATGLHPAMTDMQNMFNNGQLKIIQGVSYPQPNFSHFRATDIWMTGADSNSVVTSGWAGRYLNYEYPNFPNGYPNATMPDPLAIQVGAPATSALEGPMGSLGISISSPTSLYNFVNNIQDPAPPTDAGKELTFVRSVQRESQAYGSVVKNAYLKGANIATYPAKNSLGAQLQIVARLIKGGLKTRVYMVNTAGDGSFDTHSNQVITSDVTTGVHADRLGSMSSAIGAFQNDLGKLGIQDRVLGMTFSEFGRRIKSNTSLGTDHGVGLPVFVFGTKIVPGILGTNPVIPTAATVNDNVAMQYDFRSVYASMLKDWFCVSSAELNTVLLNNFQSLSIVNSPNCISTSIHEANVNAGYSVISSYPNPFTFGTTIEFETFGGYTLIQIFDTEGHLVATPVDAEYVAGKYNIWYNGGHLPRGLYYTRLQNGAIQQVKALVKAE